MSRIIAVCGRKRSGKDTFADYICSKYGYENVKFAGVLKGVCRMVFGFTENQIETDEKDSIDIRYDKTPREIMQYVGTELFQFGLQEFIPSIGRLLWTNSLLDSLENKNVVISDLRFKHEAEELKRRYPLAMIIMIKRNNQSAVQDSHISENEIDSINYDYCIDNNSTLSEFYRIIDSVIN